MYLLDEDGKLVGGQRRPDDRLQLQRHPNLLDEPSLQLRRRRLARGHRRDRARQRRRRERPATQIGDEVTVIAPSGDSVEACPPDASRWPGTAEFNGGGTAGATLLIFSTEGAQEVFLGGRDVFTSVALTAAPGVTQQQLADAAEQVLPTSYEAVEGDTVAKEAQDSVERVPRRHHPVPGGVRRDRDPGRRLHHRQHLLDPGGAAGARAGAAAGARRQRRAGTALGAARGGTDGADRLLASGSASGCCCSRALATLFRSFGLDISGDALDPDLDARSRWRTASGWS